MRATRLLPALLCGVMLLLVASSSSAVVAHRQQYPAPNMYVRFASIPPNQDATFETHDLSGTTDTVLHVFVYSYDPDLDTNLRVVAHFGQGNLQDPWLPRFYPLADGRVATTVHDWNDGTTMGQSLGCTLYGCCLSSPSTCPSWIQP